MPIVEGSRGCTDILALVCYSIESTVSFRKEKNTLYFLFIVTSINEPNFCLGMIYVI